MRKTKFLPQLTLLMIALAAIQLKASDTDPANPVWLTDIEEALAKAKTQQRPILMVFSGSDWCRPCIKLRKEVFEQKKFHDFAKASLVLLKVDFPRNGKNKLAKAQLRHNEKLAEKYNDQGDFPLVLLLQPDGKILGKTGYLGGGPEVYLTRLQSFLPTRE